MYRYLRIQIHLNLYKKKSEVKQRAMLIVYKAYFQPDANFYSAVLVRSSFRVFQTPSPHGQPDALSRPGLWRPGDAPACKSKGAPASTLLPAAISRAAIDAASVSRLQRAGGPPPHRRGVKQQNPSGFFRTGFRNEEHRFIYLNITREIHRNRSMTWRVFG